MNASRSKREVFNHEIAEKTEVLRRNNECDCTRTEDVNTRLVNGGQNDKDLIIFKCWII
jgi:hypothetical protein